MDSILTNHAALAAAVIGGVVVLKYALGFLSGCYARLIRPGKDLKKYGKWAVVTGATDGIGLAMCKEFAKKGLNVSYFTY